MFNPPDGPPVLKLYREPVKEETEDQRTIKKLQAELEEKRQAIATLEYEKRTLESKLYCKDIVEKHRMVGKFINAPKEVGVNPPKMGDIVTVAFDEIFDGYKKDTVNRNTMYGTNHCAEIPLNDPNSIPKESMIYDPANYQLIYKDKVTGNVVRTVDLRDTRSYKRSIDKSALSLKDRVKKLMSENKVLTSYEYWDHCSDMGVEVQNNKVDEATTVIKDQNGEECLTVTAQNPGRWSTKATMYKEDPCKDLAEVFLGKPEVRAGEDVVYDILNRQLVYTDTITGNVVRTVPLKDKRRRT